MPGHFSAGFTMDAYAHVTNQMQQNAADKIGGFIAAATGELAPEPPELPTPAPAPAQ